MGKDWINGVAIREVTPQSVREAFDYDPATGIVRWRKQCGPRCRVGAQVGTKHYTGYLTVKLAGKRHQLHRIIWLWMTGHWPPVFIDHKNGKPLDNRWANLRLATVAENNRNCFAHRDNKLNTKGVSEVKSRRGVVKYRAQIKHRGKVYYLGQYDTIELAANAYKIAAATMHGEYMNAGSRE